MRKSVTCFKDPAQQRLLQDMMNQMEQTDKLVNAILLAGSATWGSIIGTLADQTDLQEALDAKVDV